MREQWASAIRSRLAGDGGPYGLLDPAALADAVELFASTTHPQDILESCHLVGMLHWHRGMAFADERARREIETAVALLHVVHRAPCDLPLPELLLQSFTGSDASAAGAVGKPATGWEQLLQTFEPWLHNGADPHRLRLAVSAGRNAVRGLPLGHRARAKYLSFLGAAQQRLFEHSGDLAALEDAVETGRAAAVQSHAEDPDRPMHLSNLANSLFAAYERTGDVELLQEAVDIGRHALQVTPYEHGRRYQPLCGLSLSLRRLYERTNDAALLEEAAEASAAAMDAMPDGRVEPAVLANYGSVLSAQFGRTGDQSVLNKAIGLARTAVGASRPGTPLHLACLYNLGTLLQSQFRRTGDLPALEEAIDAVLGVIRATPEHHPDAPMYRSTLAGQLRARFDRTGDTADLDAAITWGYAAVEETPQDHPNQAMYLTNLAVALKARAERTDDLGSLREAIDVERLAADAAAGMGRDQALVLSNLGNSLRTYFERTGEAAALEEAIDFGLAAVAKTPEDHEDKSPCEINLALSLSTHGLANGHERLVDEAIRLLEKAASRESARPAARVAAAQEWGRLAMLMGQTERAARGFAVGVELLPLLAARGLARADATRWIARHFQLAGDAAACALEVGRADRAVELLELGRGVLLAQALESRTDLTDLRDRDPALADRFRYLCTQLDTDGAAGRASDGSPNHAAPDRRRELAEELAGLIRHIRTLPGLEGYLLPPQASRLAAEAHSGPIVVINVSQYRCDALILVTEGVQVQPLPALDPSAIHDRLTAMRDALDQAGSSGPGRLEAERGMHDILSWLWDTVTEPVLRRLDMLNSPERDQSWRHIWWVPCGLLAYFPLHAAGHHLETPARARRTVMDRAVSSYTPTVRALTHARGRQASQAPRGLPRPPRLLAVAMPRTPCASDLPGAQRELEQLAQLFPAMQELVEEDATYDAVLSHLPTASWAHFACHAHSDPADPSNSHLLAHDHARKPLSVLEISRLRLEESELAYLSACSTAVTSHDLTDEAIHVVTAFQLAGYPHVVGTLWEIDDAIASEISRHIYADLASSGFDAGRAGSCVHQATRLIRDRYPRMPTLWAAHVHTGA